MRIRPATPQDAAGMCRVLNPLIAAGGTTALTGPFDTAGMAAMFITPPSMVSCTVAVEEDDTILGFQSLEWAAPNWIETYDLPEDWSVIATFVMPGLARRGIGSKLFAVTQEAARCAGVVAIDATIRRENAGGQTYYDRMGFMDYRTSETSIRKRFVLLGGRS